MVFDVGSVWLDGRADFSPSLMWGYRPRSGGSLSLAGTVENAPKITRLILERVLVHGVA